MSSNAEKSRGAEAPKTPSAVALDLSELVSYAEGSIVSRTLDAPDHAAHLRCLSLGPRPARRATADSLWRDLSLF